MNSATMSRDEVVLLAIRAVALALSKVPFKRDMADIALNDALSEMVAALEQSEPLLKEPIVRASEQVIGAASRL